MNRYAVPVAALDRVHVRAEEQVCVHATADGPRGEATWGGALASDASAAGGAGGPCADGDGE